MNQIIVGMGEALWDVLPEGKKLGGAPANFAYHVSQFGLNSRVVSAVGQDKLGAEILENFREKNLNCMIESVPYPTGTVQVELDVIIDGYVRIVGGVRPAQCLYLFGIVGGILGPLVEIRGLVGITQVAEDGIWLQPFLVGFVEITESIRCQHLFPFLLEDEVEVFPLCLVHSFVVQ